MVTENDDAMEVTLRFKELTSDLQHLSHTFDGTLRFEKGWGEVGFDYDITGKCRGFNVGQGFAAYLFDLEPREDLVLKLGSLSRKSINLIYCQERYLEQKFPHESYWTRLGFRQNILIRDRGSRYFYLKLPKGRRVVFSLVKLAHDSYTPSGKHENATLRDVFMNSLVKFEKELPKRHLGRISPETSAHLDILAGDIRSTDPATLEAALFNMVHSQINRYKIDKGRAHADAPLKLYDLDKVLAVSGFIKDNLGEELSVSRIQQLTGLNPTKLQAGFRYLFKMSVNNFITETRLERALKLIQDTELSISEVVYSVGFSSRSYFTKIFKKRFRILPSECAYRNDQNLSSTL